MFLCIVEPGETPREISYEEAVGIYREQIQMAYMCGYNCGRYVGQNEMLQSLRGDPEERATTEIIARRAAGMVH